MRRPIHANPDAPHMAVVVFGHGSKKAVLEVTGSDPSNLAKAVSDHSHVAPHERLHIRDKVRSAAMAMQKRVIPNLTDMQLDVGGRRIRIKEIQ